ncbi:hypothetical protein CLV62_101276 [Dysgonomonas alginatilytica]|uniref:Uncharacterized protein n=1 Tax=Dysgonomonas alginatilytica TaxID=1605892 RepID=A0A2V3PTT0_9BACT|nr:hypothetical protein [Dysgonomonas alginatilytica]PXV69009.1 hypothetical protein CLV62_101276 [Dysgonomonas alginatilytica]
MTRKDLENINKDKEIIELRMQSEDLINNVESLSDEDFRNEALRIEKEIDDRISVLYQKMKD